MRRALDGAPAIIMFSDQLQELSRVPSAERTPELLCPKIGKIFRVQETEVAMLELRGHLLSFVYPPELKDAGAIPISSLAVAARTARTHKSEIYNTFTQVQHFSIFELVKLGTTGLDSQIIQKLMSVAIRADNNRVWGVIQISRKGPRPAVAGPDFTPEDLSKLEAIATVLGKMMAS